MRILPSRKYSSGSRWSLWRWTDVDFGDSTNPYLIRLHLFQTPWFSLMLHWILREDPQPDEHDHPVSFLSIVLRGSYLEKDSMDGLLRFPYLREIKWFNFKRATDRHKIMFLEGEVLTLVFAGPSTRTWRFHTENGWVPWREYND